jgi:molecular chaperone GrpE
MSGEDRDDRRGNEAAEAPAGAHGALKAQAPGADPGADLGADAGVEQVEQDIAEIVETARRERDEYLDMLRRVQADFENYKKRMLRQQTDLLERAAEGLVGRLLPVLDAFDLARAHLEAEGSPEGKALLQAAALLSDTLAKEGLERVEADGALFDPTVHEAVEHEAGSDASGGEGAEPKGPVVTEVLRPGYRYKGRVVRPAMVRVRG